MARWDDEDDEDMQFQVVGSEPAVVPAATGTAECEHDYRNRVCRFCGEPEKTA